jgi:hypothetical protein
MLGQLLRRVRHAIGQRRFEADLAEEMEFHRAMHQRHAEAGGLDPRTAHQAAQRAFGSTSLASDQSRDVWL